jgi:RimJ/RimL family protein N-acetyltransferase
MNYILATERLLLREFTFADTDFIIELLNSQGWLDFVGDRNVRTHEQAVAYLENGAMRSYKENGYGLSLVVTKADRKPIGMCGIINRTNLENPDIGFAFLPTYQGQGFGYEIAHATLLHAKVRLHLATVCAITLPNNTRSIRLLEKIGMKWQKSFFMEGDGEELMLYSTSI